MKRFKKWISCIVIVLLIVQWFNISGLDIMTKYSAQAQGTDIKVNFQPAGSDIPDGYIPDYGEIYGDRNGYTYGWNTDHENDTVSRAVYSEGANDTFCQLQDGDIWEIELESGTYDVTVSVGDAVYSSTNTMEVEGIPYWDNITLGAGEFAVETKQIEVWDGKLTVEQGEGEESTSPINYIIISPSEEIVPDSSNYSVKLQMYNENKTLETNNISPKYKLENTGAESIDLEKIKIRYYYTVEGEQNQNFYCDWSNIGSNNIIGSFVKFPQPSEGADHYLELGFKAGTGNLEPGEKVEIHTRISKVDWSNYNQSDDYSFNETASDYIDWNKATVYFEDDLIWGEDSEALSPVSEIQSLKVQMYNTNTSDISTTIYPRYKLVNTGNITVNIHDVKIRYYYTGEGEIPQNFYCDWSSIGAGNITGIFVGLDNPCEKADRYLELSFAEGTGVLGPEGSIEIHTRMAQKDWSEYTQTNDYSFNEEASDYVDWDKVTVYINGELTWGVEPMDIPPEIIDKELPLIIQMYNGRRTKNGSTIAPKYRIYNTGTLPINLSDVKIRYFYTINGEKEQNFYCDWSNIGSSQVTGRFEKLLDSKPNGDYYFELGFKNSAGVIYPEEWVEVHTRFAKTDWDNYAQTDDYSFNSTAPKYENWTKVNGYLDGVLVWGEAEFFGIPENIDLEANENTIEIQWDEVEFATDYELEIDGEIYEANDSNHYTHTDLLPGSEHTYRVRATTKAVKGNWSNAVKKWTLPDIPQNITVQSTSDDVVIVWDEVNGATGYDVEVYGTPIDNGTKTEYTDNNLNPNTQYAYRVRSKNSSGVGKWSPIIAETTIPAAPQNLEATATDTSITVTWDAVSGAGAYEILIDGETIEEVTAANYSHNELLPNTTHTYSIRSKNSEGASEWSETISATTLPSTPSNLTAVSKDTEITVTWDEALGADGYDIEVDGVVIDNDSSMVYVHTGLQKNSEHFYRVRARNGEITSLWSEQISKVTLLGKPINLTTTATSTEIRVSWNSVPGAEGYDIEVDGEIIDNGLNTTYIHDGLASNTQHTYRVRVRNSEGPGEWSDTVIEMTLLGIPINLSAASTSEAITLTWDSVPGVSSYDVLVDGEIIDNGSDTTYVHNGLEPNTWHIYRVRARSGEYVGDWSEGITWATLVGIPTNVTLEATTNKITITWDDVIGATGYEIEVDGVVVDNSTSTTYVHSGLSSNTLHNYRVRAKNENGIGDWSSISDWSTLQPQITAPDIPKNLRATATTTEITITWDKADGADDYDIEVDGVVIENIKATSYIHTGLEPNTWHLYRVRAKNEGGTSQWSEELQQNTNPEIAVNVGKDTTFNFVVVVPKKEGASTRTIVVNYNPDELEVIDLCAVTPETNLETGNIEGTNITVTDFSPGEIKYTISNEDKTVINSIKFIDKVNEYSKITYCVE